MWIPYLVLLKSVLIFHQWDFYGTDNIPEKYGGHKLIFQEIAHRRMDRVYTSCHTHGTKMDYGPVVVWKRCYN